MPQPNNAQSQPTSPIKAPVCPACQAQMRLVRVEPHSKFMNLDQFGYACYCGETTMQIVSRP